MITLEEELKNIEEGIRRLKIEYHIFFNGSRKRPPEDLKLRLEKKAKQLSERSDMTHAQRFRYNTLLTRYYTYRNLWRRTLQEMEKPRDVKETPARSGLHPCETSPVEKFRISLSDPKTEQAKVRSLYNALCLITTKNGTPNTPQYQQFEKYIDSQTHSLCNRYGCSRIAYAIALEGGVVRFTAAAENL